MRVAHLHKAALVIQIFTAKGARDDDVGQVIVSERLTPDAAISDAMLSNVARGGKAMLPIARILPQSRQGREGAP